MPAWFCCTRGSRGSPTKSPTASKPDTGPAEAPGLELQSKKPKGKNGLVSLFHDDMALLPGQVESGTPRETALAAKGVGSSALTTPKGAQPGQRAPGTRPEALPLEPLVVPAQLLPGSGTPRPFTEDFRLPCAGEPVQEPPTPEGRAKGGAPSAANGAAQWAGTAWLAKLAVLLNPPTATAISQLMGREMIYKMVYLSASSAASACGLPLLGHAAGLPPAARAAAAAAQMSTLHVHLALARQQLQRELDLAAQLPKHPSLLMPQVVYEDADAARVVYDWQGVQLYDYLQQHQHLPEASCRRILREVLQGLAALHEQQWVHRNVSTEAVWVREELPEEPRVSPHGAPSAAPHGPELSATGLALSGAMARGAAAGATSTAGTEAAAEAGTGAAAERQAVTAPAGSDCGAPLDAPQPLILRLSDPGAEGAQGAGQAAEAAGERSSRATGGRTQLVDELSRRHPGGGQATARVRGKRARSVGLVARLGALQHAAKATAEGGGLPVAREQGLVGCSFHLAPEAIRGQGCGPHSDVWAAGVMLCMLLTGRPPFRGHNELEVLTRVLLSADVRGGGNWTHKGNSRRAVLPPTPLSKAPLPLTGAALRDLRASLDAAPLGGVGAAGSAPARPAALEGGSAGGPPLRSAPSGWLAAAPGGVRQSQGGNQGSDTGSHPGEQGRDVDSLEELVVQVVLESRASAECREVLSAMLVADPTRRRSAAELLRLPWFAADGD